MHRVVDKFIIQLEAQLADRNVTIELSQDARALLAELGYDVAMGARPMGRIIQEKIKKPLSEELLFGELIDGGAVHISVSEGEFVFSYPLSGQKTIAQTEIKKLPKTTEDA